MKNTIPKVLCRVTTSQGKEVVMKAEDLKAIESNLKKLDVAFDELCNEWGDLPENVQKSLFTGDLHNALSQMSWAAGELNRMTSKVIIAGNIIHKIIEENPNQNENENETK